MILKILVMIVLCVIGNLINILIKGSGWEYMWGYTMGIIVMLSCEFIDELRNE